MKCDLLRLASTASALHTDRARERDAVQGVELGCTEGLGVQAAIHHVATG